MRRQRLRAGRAKHQRRAVGGAFGERFRGDQAGIAGPVLDQHGLADVLGHFLRDDAREDVVRAPGREADQQVQRLRGQRLRERRGRDESQ
jgi:hypothetical protein